MAETTGKSNGVDGAADTIPLGLYLWTRIKQVGVNRIFGVPGDFNLTLLDHIYDVDGLEWVGNTNELNAAYAADGYARTMHGAGCLVTTHGVGELSALNGIAGSMTEQVRVIHVVGQTSRMMQEKKMMIHHSIGPEPDHQIFNKASVNFRVAAAELTSEKGAAEEIDRVLRECYVKSGPVYIFVPIDIVDLQVPAAALKQPLDLSPPKDDKLIEAATDAVLSALYESKNPAIFVDCLVDRHNAIKELETLIEKVSCPVFATNMGKGIIDETHPNYLGVYNGMVSSLGIAAAVEKSDCVLIVGSLASDTNSGGFTRKVLPENAIYLDAFSTTVNMSSQPSLRASMPRKPRQLRSQLFHLGRKKTTSLRPKSPNLTSGPPSPPSCNRMMSSSAKQARQPSAFQTQPSRPKSNGSHKHTTAPLAGPRQQHSDLNSRSLISPLPAQDRAGAQC
jgi:pyruvate decarboxylase